MRRLVTLAAMLALTGCTTAVPLITPPGLTAPPTTGLPTRASTAAPSIAPDLSPSSGADGSGAPASGPVTGVFLEVVSDDLSSRGSGFQTGDFEHSRVAYEDGALTLLLKSPSRATWSMREFGDWPVAQMEATMIRQAGDGSGLFGLVCGPTNDDYYAGVLDTSGTASLLRVQAGLATPLLQSTGAVTAPVVGAEADMRLDCRGTESGGPAGVDLAVAGALVASAMDPIGFASFERAGFYAESGLDSSGFKVGGDDVRVMVGLRAEAPSPGAPTALPSPAVPASPSVPGSAAPASGSPQPSLSSSPSPGASASLPPDVETQTLIEHVPSALRATCMAIPASLGAVAAIDCPEGPVIRASYLGFLDTGTMVSAYEGLVGSHPEATGTVCPAGPSEVPYTVDDAEVGRLLCIEEEGRARVVWTDVRLDLMGDAVYQDASFDALYSWWLSAGPIP